MAGFVSNSVSGRPSEAAGLDVLVHLAGVSERGPLRNLIQSWGASVKYEYQVLPNIIALHDVPQEKLDELAAQPSVVKVEPDRAVHADLVDSTPRIQGLEDQLLAQGITQDGAGARVCILDTGINQAHIMYASRVDIAAGFDFVNNDADPSDDNGHGSHVAGIVAGGTGLEVNFQGGSGFEPLQGVAPASTLIGVKVLDASGNGLVSDIIAGIEHCMSPALPGGPADVISLSLGDELAHISVCDTDAMAMAANNAVAVGVTVVASSGNNGFPNAMHSPACASGVISVGATYDDPFPNSDFPPFSSFTFCTQTNIFGFCVQECTDSMPAADQIACYSNKSDLLDVTAPGSYIWSAVHDSPSLISGRHGTSMAAAHVSGLAALLRSGDPALTPAAIRQLIRDSAVDLGMPGPDPIFGHGRINVVDALLLAFGCTSDVDCADDLFCNGSEQCMAGQCTPGTNPCTPLLCRESDDLCVNCLTPLDCDDADPCNGQETCAATGACVNGAIVDCNGNLIADSCDLGSGSSLDCNANAIPDECDVAGGGSTDCNANGIPDECEPDCNVNGSPDDCDIASALSEDCNLNGVPDECDIASGVALDCNGNIVPDQCDLSSGASADCNANAVPDECDLLSGGALDCNANTIPDECETDCNANGIPDDCDILAGIPDCNGNGVPDSCEAVDCNANGVPDDCDVAGGTSADCNANGIPDECDVAGGGFLDCNANAIPDECEPDCNANGIPDDCDLASGGADCNGNGVLDSCETVDCNANGVPDDCDLAGGTSADCNANAIPDECDLAGGGSLDCNTNAIPDECELDCNANTIPDECDIADGVSVDCDLNGVPDDCDIASGAARDCNGNGIPDQCDLDSGLSEDCNGNGVPDECDLLPGGSPDCNVNGIPDECEPDCNVNGNPDDCDIAGGTSADCNTNAVPDECDLAGGASLDCNRNDVPDECDVDCDGDGVPDVCQAPIVTAVGGRYLAVVPVPLCSIEPIAIHLTSTTWPCLNLFLAADGTLSQTPVSATPAQWGEVFVHGMVIVPDTSYSFQAVAGPGGGAAVQAKTWVWADTDNNGLVNFSDIQRIVLGFQGAFNGFTLQTVDLVPCDPDENVNFADVQSAVFAFGGQIFSDLSCPVPCP